MKKILIVLMIALLLLGVGCSTNIHTIGYGPQKNEIEQARQWYALYGLIPLNVVNTREMAGNAKDYEIKTERNSLDVLLNLFTGFFTVVSRTVTVKK